MIVRWQCASWDSSAEDYAWAMLELSQDLMRTLEPDAEFHVTYQRSLRGSRSDTTYHHQQLDGFPGPSWGKFHPPRFDASTHEVWLDNDVILWELPRAWKVFTSAKDVAMGNLCNFGYHGTYCNHIRLPLSSGFLGLPPYFTPDIRTGWADDEGKPLPTYNHDQEEMGAAAYYLCEHFDDAHLVLVDMESEVPCYNPLSIPGSPFPVVRRRWGRHGIHLSGCNRRHFNPMPILNHIRNSNWPSVPPFPPERAGECQLC
jgi:hypothetical protein